MNGQAMGQVVVAYGLTQFHSARILTIPLGWTQPETIPKDWLGRESCGILNPAQDDQMQTGIEARI